MQGFRTAGVPLDRELLLFKYWSTHAFWSIGAVWRPGPGDDRHFGHRQHNRCSVDFLAQSGERVLQVVWFEAHSTTRRDDPRLVEDSLLGWFIAKKSNRHWARRTGTNHRGVHAAAW